MDIRCIALDLDRTTLNRDSRLSAGNRRALEYAISRGVTVVLASGRAFTTLPQDVCSIPGLEYAVTSNGAAVCRIPSGEVLMRRCLPPQSAAKILALSDETGVTYEAFVNGVAYADSDYMARPAAYGASPDAYAYLFSTRRPAEDIRLFMQLHAHELDSVDVICWDKPHIEALRSRFLAQMPEVYMTRSSGQRLEFSHLDTGKHTGVAWVLDQLGLAPSQLAAMGDNDNDIEMLRMAACGIAMENATPACRAAADFVTKHHDDDGVAYAIEHILNL